MAQLVICPQCKLEFLMPEGVDDGAWARCASCRAFFQLKDAPSREVATLEVIESATESPADDRHTKQTVADFSSMATWDGESHDDVPMDEADDSESASLRIAEELDDIEPQAALIDAGPSGAEPVANDDEPEAAELHVADFDDETVDLDSPTVETPEAAAERIDAWFRSAKTPADVPQESEPADPRAESEAEKEPTGSAMDNATIKLSSREADHQELSDDLELDVAGKSPQNIAAWDDSHHMERLLAELQDQPRDEYVPSNAETAAKPGNEVAQAAAEWTPDASYSMTSRANQPRGKKSMLRTMVMSAVGGLMGLGLGYFALLWLRGLEIDFLDAAKYLPKAVLPASFQSAPQSLATAPPAQATADNVSGDPAADVAGTPAHESTETAGANPKSETNAAEKTAAFTAPADVKKAAAEPAAFEAPNATPVKEVAITGDSIHINGAPVFSANELSAALLAGKDAEAGLLNGKLADSRDVARAKGFSYSILADLAQKSTFADVASSPDAAKLRHEADEVFRKLLATPHAREEVAQIVPKWIASANRRQGGVFLAGSVVSQHAKGTVSECSVDLGAGQSLPVLLPAALGEQLKGSTAQVAVVGWIVDKPAEQVTGYTGTAAQAIFAARIIPLE